MLEKIYTTMEMAKLTGVHPNTVRLYEKWGYISKAKRKKNNYREFTEKHLYQMKLARVALPGPYPINGKIVHEIVRQFANGEIENSLKLADEYLKKVDVEKRKAKEALIIFDKWFEQNLGDKQKIIFQTRKKVVDELSVSLDALRTWERNGLFSIQKDRKNRLLFTEWDVEKIMVIRLLRKCGFSIASLLRVFANEDELVEKPSKLLSLPDSDSDVYYVTDMFLMYLDEHRERAKSIIKLIEGSFQV